VGGEKRVIKQKQTMNCRGKSHDENVAAVLTVAGEGGNKSGIWVKSRVMCDNPAGRKKFMKQGDG
jgi:hypothetical protein